MFLLSTVIYKGGSGGVTIKKDVFKYG